MMASADSKQQTTEAAVLQVHSDRFFRILLLRRGGSYTFVLKIESVRFCFRGFDEDLPSRAPAVQYWCPISHSGAKMAKHNNYKSDSIPRVDSRISRGITGDIPNIYIWYTEKSEASISKID
jgi:hypothetical protein